jgi:PST family polysaccharide transporter
MKCPDVPTASLKSSAARAAVWSAVQVGGSQATSFVVFLILTRMLSPLEVGLVALSAGFIDILGPLMRGGLPEALIQSETVTERQAETCFWSTLGASVLMAGGLALLAGPVGRLFALPLLVPVIRAMSPLLVLGALTATHEARITRSLGFKALALRTLASNLIGGAVGIGMAFGGFGVWSLVWQRIVAASAATVFVWMALPWAPRLRVSAEALKTLGRFGMPMIAGTFLSSLNGRVLDFLLGYSLGPAVVGEVRVASRCLDAATQLAASPLISIALPTLSRLQCDAAAFERALRRLVQLAGLLVFPLYFGLAFVSLDLMPIAFGSKWHLSGSLLRIMSLGALPVVLQFFTWPALAARGRSDQAALGIFLVVASQILVTAVTAHWGPTVVVSANVLRSYMMLPISLALLHRHTGVNHWHLVRSTWLPLSGAGVMAVALLAMSWILSAATPVMRLVLMTAVGVTTYGVFTLASARELVADARAVLRRSPKDSRVASGGDTGGTSDREHQAM